LRRQIEGDLAAAKLIGAGGYDPQRWDTDPPGQVNPARIEGVGAAVVSAALGCGHPATWVRVESWDRCPGDPEDMRESGEPVALVNNGRREADHICRHDPRNVVADCEAKLDILDEHPESAGDPGHCARCQNWMFAVAAPWPCTTIRRMAAGYRHRPGYQEEDWEK
jgi:hypothetical protein